MAETTEVATAVVTAVVSMAARAMVEAAKVNGMVAESTQA